MVRWIWHGRTPIVFSGAALLAMVGVLLCSTSGWATTRLGTDVELQAWYRMRHTFHTDGEDHFDWVQWRNEFFGWLTWENFVKNGTILDRLPVPGVKQATLNARYRFRFDPVYLIRDRYRERYNSEERDSFVIPENGFRDVFIDLDFGSVGLGRLSSRIGNQQIVWGEADLFRSLDIINPLRIDQNTFAGEKFDEFRTPIFALKFLYTIGNIGEWFSDVGIEPWYSPRFRTSLSDVISEGQFRLPYRAKGCLDDNGRLIPFDIVRCAQPRADGRRFFVPARPGWIGHRRQQHPWSFLVVMGPTQKIALDDGICLTRECSPDVFGQRASMIPHLKKGQGHHYFRGWGGVNQGGGVRILGRSVVGIDFSLNYMFIPQGVTGVFDLNRFLNDPRRAPGPPSFRPELFYGDAELIDLLFGLPPGTGAAIRSGDFAAGLRRCLSDSGKSNDAKGADRGHKAPTILVGADLQGYDLPARFGPKGALQPDGNPKPGRHQAARPPLTFCLPALHDHWWTHVIGFTATYNDFDYTGAVFRLEQSFSTKEVIRKLPGGFGARAGQDLSPESFRTNFHAFTGVWRSMVGFDLFRSLGFFRYIPGLHPSFYDQAWFITGQWLVENYWNNLANNICQNSDNIGNGLTKEEAEAFRAANPGLRVYSNPRCKRYRWNHLLTLVLSNQGLFGSRLETRNAVAFEPRAQQYLLYTQNWWRNVLGYPNLELSFGLAWFPGSYHDVSWSALNYYAWRDQLWFEFTYYLL